MKFFLLFLTIFVLNLFSFSQTLSVKSLRKPNLDISVFNNWPSIYRFGISGDGKFIWYTITYGNDTRKEILTIKSRFGNWQAQIANVTGDINFSSDSKKLFCLTSGDSLSVVSLDKPKIDFINGVRSFKLIHNSTAEYLVYQINSTEINSTEMVMQDLKNQKEVTIRHVLDYEVDEDGKVIFLKIDSASRGDQHQFLFRKNLGDESNWGFVYKGKNIRELITNKEANALAFTTEDNGCKSILLYTLDGRIKYLISDTSTSIGEELMIDRISGFSKDGAQLFIYLKQKSLPKPKPGFIKINIWSYTDPVVQSRQKNTSQTDKYLAKVDLRDGKLARLQNQNDKRINLPGDYTNFIYFINQTTDDLESYWIASPNNKAGLISIEDGKTKTIEKPFRSPSVSPDGKFMIGFDAKGRDIYSHELSTGKLINLTKSLPVDLPADNLKRDFNYDRPGQKDSRGLSYAAWSVGARVIIYDEFDIWEIDLKGEKKPVNLTGGYGRKNKIELRLAGLNAGTIVSEGDTLILKAFSKLNKKSGFFKIILGKDPNPLMISMGNYVFGLASGQSLIKANDANVYLVKRESATQSPNLYWTSDFKSFNLISSLFPEKQYNWLTTELKSFQTLDGRTDQGVLYKPEDFDPNKKYPVIIHYYENKSNELNKFRNPRGGNDGGDLDIAWYVSRNYIVFTPDIHYKIGDPGKSVYNSVVAAANYLKTLPYVSPGKIGIQGHSWGGYETNYLVANSNVFAAAITSSGPSNFITGYLSDNPLEQRHDEVAQMRLGKSLWEDIPMYIRNSPVFKAYLVTTPIMLVHNRIDNNVPFIQGLEWFMALRRLGKRAWMLQYDEGGHGVSGDDYVDYVIRSTQFFDHYLKDSACPKWMLYGIPAKMKGIDDGLDLVREKDKNGEWLTPKEGTLLMDEQKQKVQKLRERK